MRPGEIAPVHGNAEIVRMLEHWLGEARKGQLNYMALVAAQQPNHYAHDFTGVVEMEPVVHEAIAALQNGIREGEQNRTLPPRDMSLGADFVCYNVALAPVSWDFLIWLVDAEMTRIREGAPAPLKVAFWFGRDGNAGLANEYRRTMFMNVVRPLLPLIGAVEDDRAMGGRHKPLYVLRDITAASRAGEAVPLLKPLTEVHAFLQRPITITLRESEHWPHRNSNIRAWLRFAGDIADDGERVIFIRDTAKAYEPLRPFETFGAASENVAVRMAIYAQAKCNMLIANGPCGLCLFSDRPYLYFQAISPDDPHFPNRPGWWQANNGVAEGEQLPWALPTQRMVWEADTYEAISRAWDAHRCVLDAKAEVA